jgi:hypothetical protein
MSAFGGKADIADMALRPIHKSADVFLDDNKRSQTGDIPS